MDPTTAPAGGNIWGTLGDIFSNGIVTGTAQAVDQVLNPQPAPAQTVAASATAAKSTSSNLLIALAILAGLAWVAFSK